MISLDKELQKKKDEQQTVVQQGDAVQQVKLLMEGEATEDMRILRALGKNHTLVRAQEDYGKQLELENLEKAFHGKVFTVDQIKSLCVQYRLRFLSTRFFIGNMDIEAVAKIKEFAKATNSSIDNASIEYKMFILAPPEQFALSRKQIEKIPKRVIDRDPVLFYKIDDTHYKMLHKWGNDFSIARFIEGFQYRSFWNFVTVRAAKLLPLVAIATTLLLPTPFKLVYPIAFWLINLLVTFIITRISVWKMYNANDMKPRNDFFTPHNWDSTEQITH